MVRLLSDHSTPFPDKLVSHRAYSEHGNHAKDEQKTSSSSLCTLTSLRTPQAEKKLSKA